MNSERADWIVAKVDFSGDGAKFIYGLSISRGLNFWPQLFKWWITQSTG